MRKLISIRIDPKIYQKARELSLNISKTCENSLKHEIQRLTNVNQETNCISTCDSTSQKQGGAGNGIRTHAAQQGHRLSRPSWGRTNNLSAVDIYLVDFKDFLVVDRQLATRTVKGHLRQIKRLLKTVESNPRSVTRQALREYLKVFNGRPANTYRNVLKSLRVFFEFLGRPELVSSFKFPPKAVRVVKVTSTEDMRSFYSEIDELRAKAMFLMYATSGLRRDELLGLKRKDIDPEMRMIIPGGNDNRTKRTYVTFYNEEAAEALKDTLPKDPETRIFPVSEHYFRKMAKKIRDKIGVYLTPQLLREWFCSEMGELGVPDRYIDAFCGRVPRSVLARHYTDYSPERLKRIYVKANLKVLA